jgi:integrase
VIRLGATTDTEETTYDDVWSVNVKAAYFLTGALAPSMVARGGSAVINIGSINASYGGADSALAWVLAIVCGMRRGELAGLKWSKVDLDSGVLHVHWQRAVASGEVKGGVVEKEPKGKSRRSIALGPLLVDLLRLLKERQEVEEERPRPCTDGSGTCFVARTGCHIARSSSPTGSGNCAWRPEFR